MECHLTRGLWKEHDPSWNIKCLEMLAVLIALRHFNPDIRANKVLVQTDNMLVVSYINHQGI